MKETENLNRPMITEDRNSIAKNSKFKKGT